MKLFQKNRLTNLLLAIFLIFPVVYSETSFEGCVTKGECEICPGHLISSEECLATGYRQAKSCNAEDGADEREHELTKEGNSSPETNVDERHLRGWNERTTDVDDRSTQTVDAEGLIYVSCMPNASENEYQVVQFEVFMVALAVFSLVTVRQRKRQHHQRWFNITIHFQRYHWRDEQDHQPPESRTVSTQ